MNPLTNIKNLNAMNDRELDMGVAGTSRSWHNEYRDSAWVFTGGLPYELTEGDVLAVFSQYGEIVHINLVRDLQSGKSKGFGFVCYEDQRSTILAVDNLNGIRLCKRTIRVDHVQTYKLPKDLEKLDADRKRLFLEGCAPKPIGGGEDQDEDGEKEGNEEEEEDKKGGKKKKKKKDKKKKKKKERDKDKVRKVQESSSSDSEEDSGKTSKGRDREVKKEPDSSSREENRGSRIRPRVDDFERGAPRGRDRNRSRSRERSGSRDRDRARRDRSRSRDRGEDRRRRVQRPSPPRNSKQDRRSRSRSRERRRDLR